MHIHRTGWRDPGVDAAGALSKGDTMTSSLSHLDQNQTSPELSTHDVVEQLELRLAGGFDTADQELIDQTLARTTRRLSSLERGASAELSVKDRDGAHQLVTLEAWVPGWPRLVASSEQRELRDALNEVGQRMNAQLNSAATRREPRNNRRHRETIRKS